MSKSKKRKVRNLKNWICRSFTPISLQQNFILQYLFLTFFRSEIDSSELLLLLFSTANTDGMEPCLRTRFPFFVVVKSSIKKWHSHIWKELDGILFWCFDIASIQRLRRSLFGTLENIYVEEFGTLAGLARNLWQTFIYSCKETKMLKNLIQLHYV